MFSKLITFAFSSGAVVLAEMGDKTQLLAMAFAARYKAAKVLLGVFLATVLNHALAVAIGSYATRFKFAEVWIQGIASLSFILFGLWTIKGDRLEGEENLTTRFGPVITVAFAFFLAEMGDKTQLTTIALAAKFPEYPEYILMGTTAGMLIADAIGIIIGVVMCRKIPEKSIKLISAGIFIFFGFWGCCQLLLQKTSLSGSAIVSLMSLLVLLTLIAALFLILSNGSKKAFKPKKY